MSSLSRPFPIQLEVEFLDRLNEPVREGRASSVSTVIRAALERFDFANVVVVRPPQVSISVRLSPEIRRNLEQIAHTKHASVGQLVRAAVEAYLGELERGNIAQLRPPAVAESVLAARPARKKKRRRRPAPSDRKRTTVKRRTTRRRP